MGRSPGEGELLSPSAFESVRVMVLSPPTDTSPAGIDNDEPPYSDAPSEPESLTVHVVMVLFEVAAFRWARLMYSTRTWSPSSHSRNPPRRNRVYSTRRSGDFPTESTAGRSHSSHSVVLLAHRRLGIGAMVSSCLFIPRQHEVVVSRPQVRIDSRIIAETAFFGK